MRSVRAPQVNSRRGRAPFVVLMMAACAAGALALQAAGPDLQLVGRQTDGSVVITTNQVLTPAGRQVEFQGRPLAVALSPDRRTAAFLNGTYQAIILVD